MSPELGEVGEVIRNSTSRMPDMELEDEMVESMYCNSKVSRNMIMACMCHSIIYLDLVGLTNDVEGSDTEEQDASSGVAMDVRNGRESDALMDAQTSRKYSYRTKYLYNSKI